MRGSGVYAGKRQCYAILRQPAVMPPQRFALASARSAETPQGTGIPAASHRFRNPCLNHCRSSIVVAILVDKDPFDNDCDNDYRHTFTVPNVHPNVPCGKDRLLLIRRRITFAACGIERYSVGGEEGNADGFGSGK